VHRDAPYAHYGYDDESATDVLHYVASIFARGDVKKH
jgi:serine protein kinase